MTYNNFADVPWYRRSSQNNLFVFLGLIGLLPFGIFSAYLLLTGDIYFNKQKENGTLKTWGIINKIWAVIVVFVWSLVFIILVMDVVKGDSIVKFNRDQYQVVMPFQWEWRNDLSNSGLDLQIGNKPKNAYCRILEVEDADDFDLKTLGEEFNSAAVASLEDLNTSQPVSLQINGRPAIRYEYTCTTDGLRIKYWQVFLEVDQKFLMAVLWSTESQFEHSRKDMEQIIQSIDSVIPNANE